MLEEGGRLTTTVRFVEGPEGMGEQGGQRCEDGQNPCSKPAVAPGQEQERAAELRQDAAKIWLLLRGPDLAASMSRYLADRITGLPNVEVVTQARISRLEGRDGVLEAVRWRNAASVDVVRQPVRRLFLFIGAEPNTGWLPGSGVSLDANGYVLTGADVASGHRSLETCRHGVFSIGDVRSGSVKRVAAAVGEGAQVVAILHAYLSATGPEPMTVTEMPGAKVRAAS